MRAHCQRLHDVSAAPKAAVHQDWHPAADRLDNFRQHRDGRADTVLDASPVVGNNDRIDTGVGGELCVLKGENALEHEFDFDPVPQSFDCVPGQVGDNGAAHAAKIDTGEVRLARKIVVQPVAASALARIGPPKSDECFPFRR